MRVWNVLRCWVEAELIQLPAAFVDYWVDELVGICSTNHVRDILSMKDGFVTTRVCGWCWCLYRLYRCHQLHRLPTLQNTFEHDSEFAHWYEGGYLPIPSKLFETIKKRRVLFFRRPDVLGKCRIRMHLRYQWLFHDGAYHSSVLGVGELCTVSHRSVWIWWKP